MDGYSMFINRKTDTVKILVLPSLIYRFNPVLIIIPASSFFVWDINKLIFKFVWRSKRPRIANTILKENRVGGLTLPDIKTYYKAMVILIMWYWQRTDKENRQRVQWKRIKSPEIDPHKYNNWFFDKGTKTIQWSKIVFSTNGAGTTGHQHI